MVFFSRRKGKFLGKDFRSSVSRKFLFALQSENFNDLLRCHMIMIFYHP